MDFSDKANLFNAPVYGKVTCIYGESGSGKSTLATRLRKPGTVVLDGDGVRCYINDDLGFSGEDRRENNIRIAKIALYLSLQGFDVIISTVRADIAFEYLNGKVDRIELIEAAHEF